MPARQKVNLIVVAHPDDEILGFGGTGQKLVADDEIVQPVILCCKADARTNKPSDQELYNDIIAANNLLGFNEPVMGNFPNIKMNTVDHLDIVQFIEASILKFQPERIFTHHPGDLNDDHVCVAGACMAASRYYQRRNDIKPLISLHLMEILSSTEWGYPVGDKPFSPNMFVNIEKYIDGKINALNCYRNVMREPPHPRSVEVIKALAIFRGAQCGNKYSEAFQTVFQQGL